MPQHWLLCFTEDNFLISMKKGLLGFSERKSKTAHRFQPGDKVAFYISKKSVSGPRVFVGLLRGTAEIAETAYMDDSEVWYGRGGEIYPYRVPIKSVTVSEGVPLKPLAGQLSFTQENSLYWAVALKPGVVAISPEDWAVVTGALRQPVGSSGK